MKGERVMKNSAYWIIMVSCVCGFLLVHFLVPTTTPALRVIRLVLKGVIGWSAATCSEMFE